MKNKKILNYIFYSLIGINIIIDIIHIIINYNYAINGGCNYNMNNTYEIIYLIIGYILPLIVLFLYMYKSKNKYKLIILLVSIIFSLTPLPSILLFLEYIKNNLKNKTKYYILISIIYLLTSPAILFSIINILMHIFNTDLIKILTKKASSWYGCLNGYKPYF